MRFHNKIMLAALCFTLLVAGTRAFPGAEGAADLTYLADPGFWLALGENLVGAQENGWCSCS